MGLVVVLLFKPRDEQLDPGVVGEDLRRGRQLPAEHAAQDRVEEQHRVCAEGPVRTARLEEMHGRSGHPEQLDLPGHLLDELVPLLLAGSERGVHWLAPLGMAGRLLEGLAERLVRGGAAEGEDNMRDRRARGKLVTDRRPP